MLDIVLNAAPGAAVALILGWGPVGALVMAGVTYISSSGIVAKVLGDLGRLGNRETPVVLSILVFEDLAMAVYLPILTAVLVGVEPARRAERRSASRVRGDHRRAGGRAALRPVRLDDRRQRRTARCSCSRCSALALLVAGFASAMQVSAAVGAFLLGIAISGSTAENATKLLEPLRDLFAAVFFVVFGLNTDPASIPPVLGWAVVLAVVTTLDQGRHRLVGGPPAGHRPARPGPGRRRAGGPRRVLHRHRRAGRDLRGGTRPSWPRWPPPTCC